MTSAAPPLRPGVLPKNDPRQYDGLVDDWWEPGGVFAMLHWLAASRADQLPAARNPGAVLVDIACGAGLFAPHAQRLGYRHLGVDLGLPGLGVARAHGVSVACADVTRLPLPDACADVVVAGEILEHVEQPEQVVSEACRVLRPGGTIVIDTIAATRWGRFTAVTVAERMPGGPPKRLHDPALFVNRSRLTEVFQQQGVPLTLHGLLPHPLDYLRWLLQRTRSVRLIKTRDTSGLFGGVGVKESL